MDTLTKPDIQIRIFLILDSFGMLLFKWRTKQKTTTKTVGYIIKTQCLQICKQGKVHWNLFGVCYWFLKLYTWLIWHSYFHSHGISLRNGGSWSGAMWVKHVICKHGHMLGAVDLHMIFNLNFARSTLLVLGGTWYMINQWFGELCKVCP